MPPRAAVVALSVLAVVTAAVAGLAVWYAHPVAFDDAYISYRYAQNLVAGDGLVFNPGDRVEGYTNFLWVMIAGAALAAGLDPFATTRFLGVASYVVTIGLSGLLIAAVVRRRRDLVLFGALALLVLPHGLARMSGSGLETAFVAAMIVLLGLTQHVFVPRCPIARQAWGLVALLACLARLDAALAVAASGVTTLVTARADGASWRQALRAPFERFGAAAAGLVLYLAWKVWYYGDIVPNSYYAKAADELNLRVGLAYLLAFAQNSPQILAMLPVAAAAPVLAWNTRFRAVAVFSVLTLGAFALYILKVGGDFMYYRFAFEIYPLYVCAFAIGLAMVVRERPAIAVTALALAVALSATPPVLETRYGMQSLEEMDRYVKIGRQAGQALAKAVPPTTRLSTTLAGTIPYYSRLFTVDQWGLNDRYIARQPGSIRYRGHVKAATLDYLYSRGVNLHLGHPRLCSCNAPCREAPPNVFIRVEGDRCLQTWYLEQTPELSRHFCADPQRFVLVDVPCPPKSSPGFDRHLVK